MVHVGREVPYAWRRRRRGLPRGLLRTDSPSARSRTTTVRPKKRACVEKTTPPKIERASPAVFCSTLRCEARFSIGRIARKLQNETLCGEDCDRMKPAQKIQARRGFWLGFCKASSAAKIVIAASRAHRDVTFSRQAVTSAPALTSPQNTQSLRCAPNHCGSARTDVDRKHVSGSPFVSC